MIKNYLKIALRNMMRHKGYSSINIFGLAIGMACCILILLWVQDELSYDKFHQNYHRLYRVEQDIDLGGGKTVWVYTAAAAVGPALKNEFPEILNSARCFFIPRRVPVAYGENIFNEVIRFADASIFEIFTFPLKKGHPQSPFKGPNSIVISEKIAYKYFGNEEPLGKTLEITKDTFMVTAVMEDIPLNSSLRFDILLPIDYLKKGGRDLNDWESNDFLTYVLLRENTRSQEVSAKISDRQSREADYTSRMFLNPFSRIYLYSTRGGYASRIQNIYIFLIVAFAILIIACINFMNLTTARYGHRAKEVGLRKVVGAGKKEMIWQFFGESFVMVFLALALGILMVQLLLPLFNNLVAKQLTLNITENLQTLMGLVGILLVTGLISGSYPALFLSSFQPVTVLKESIKSGSRGALFRKILVIFQFSLSIILIISTILIFRQLGFMRNRDLGLDKDNVICLQAGSETSAIYESMKNEWLKNPNVLNVTTSFNKPSRIGMFDGSWEWEGKPPDTKVEINKTWVGYDFLDTFKIKLLDGRFYSKKFPGDVSNSIVINEQLAKIIGPGSPVGKRFWRGDDKKTIIGVIKEFHYLPLHRKIGPMMLHLRPNYFRYIFVRVAPGNFGKTLGYLEKVFKRLNPGSPFEFSFMDEEYDKLYRNEERMGKIFNYFALLAIFISCLGLLGLASFTTEQRTKEIGIRKVLGSTVSGVVLLLSKDFARWVLAANLVAWPIAYYVMKNWLQGFAYKTGFGIWIFVLSGVIALTVALVTVSYQAIKTAMKDPVNALKYE
ncbi:MAG: FtsX-like permease family protein [Candidatus Aminicenantes bacterium]|nr:FtsX-like permease family protein [Candidatus Aminicenantes bacterium]NIM77716.1 FtsX-like permease family protein [Candidatus Aminicenantes bacterium]NIN17029.1 FtsX-like permease family protein [Candidatus Aminicenantes bacterium]NIN40922.1 FtsX-like permease family protein [Candidatus Aminicenantes bacterium]NIN83727.1 FtsX-like permease family protein [Candidatus Aminicenantes bacterium]